MLSTCLLLLACVARTVWSASNGSALTHLQRRAYYIDRSQTASEEHAKLWPDGIVRWCLMNSLPFTSRNWDNWMDEAFRFWNPDNTIDVAHQCEGHREGGDSGACLCQVGVSKVDTLRIFFDPMAPSETRMVGYTPAEFANDNYHRNMMNIGEPKCDTELLLFTVLHELGHVFGFEHEHQRPDAWSTSHGGTATDENAVFDLNCQGIDQYYQSFATKIKLPQTQGTKDIPRTDRNGIPFDLEKLCHDAQYVQSVGFAASQMLPIPNAAPLFLQDDGTVRGKANIDYDVSTPRRTRFLCSFDER
ncbi:hypothetical protein LTS18_012295 [Coniosporium uncinatum]|uniref:Uncharacterized protein n=1 Tax=Coniosporium uncinatum TaxID=93489 RepID=A0ACC3DJ29_9PEZI|nr:hypothetical protein LTS18_012295 [Coniosporium uncinatum]